MEHGIPFEDRTATTTDSGPPPLLSTRGLLDSLLGDLHERHVTRKGGGWTGGLRCGFRLIDHELRGLRHGSVTMFSAEPTMGKSTCCNQIAYQTAAFPGQHAAALYVSFEDDPAYLLLKHLSRLSGWRINDLQDGLVSTQEAQLAEAVRRLVDTPLFYLRGNAATDATVMIERARDVRRLLNAEAPLLIVVDYLQYFARYAPGRVLMDQIGMALTELGRVAEATNAALLVVGSQNREANKRGDATMFGGRGSGEIEYDADQLLVLTRDERTVAMGCGQPRKLTALKTRFGGAGAEALLDFEADFGRFDEVKTGR